MSVKALKKREHILKFYRNNYGLRHPYKVLVDGTYCVAALEDKIMITEQMPKYLSDKNVRIVTTPCVILEVEKLGKLSEKLRSAWFVVKQFAVDTCGHEGYPIPASECIKSLLKSDTSNRYILASQDKELKHAIRWSKKSMGTPTMRLVKRKPVVEKPSPKCAEYAERTNTCNSVITKQENKDLKEMITKYVGKVEPEEKPRPPKMRRRANTSKNPKRFVNSKFSSKGKWNRQTEPQTSGVKKGRGRHKKKKTTGSQPN